MSEVTVGLMSYAKVWPGAAWKSKSGKKLKANRILHRDDMLVVA
jgi:hypothetical protein